MPENETTPRPGFWTCNIDRRGRWLRLIWGLIFVGAAVWLWLAHDAVFWASGLLALGLLAIFEGFRGWCVMRACGIRTPM